MVKNKYYNDLRGTIGVGVDVGVGDGETGKDVKDGIGASAAMITCSRLSLSYLFKDQCNIFTFSTVQMWSCLPLLVNSD